eukprot:CAMPEP_0119078586 /NCGR_PEP_ID=MMETSP1178-20130426/101709_1 /TAXON_ID=33656 /ORGANISM="unid sp, Strain CCMP2000" /LENGTH=140 /DNA_ID=CAMNT_0007061039 /DNA_START=369 /DNA_END=787 /DNA_ORIENTATION=-
MHGGPLEPLLALRRVGDKSGCVLVNVRVENVVLEERLHDVVKCLRHCRREHSVRVLWHAQRSNYGDSRPDARQPALGRQRDRNLLLHVWELNLEGHARAHTGRDGNIVRLGGLWMLDVEQLALRHAIRAHHVDQHFVNIA